MEDFTDWAKFSSSTSQQITDQTHRTRVVLNSLVNQMNWAKSFCWRTCCGLLSVCAVLCGCASDPIRCSPLAGELQSRPQEILDDVHVIFVESPADLCH